MDELVSVMEEIGELLFDIKHELEDIKLEVESCSNIECMVSDINNSMDSISKGMTRLTNFDTYGLSDVCSKLEDISDNI